ncbi:YfhD family protein [Bacillus canaveralius]|uniref:YfhD family protein n=1 Tax=Bacillus canaveralius TaxID=1403243 RepID=A0A2N5GN42_9BACI|nr:MULTISPECIES: YfhD family protein [Bacillus]PLR83637.1 YfhD family protein [Bacillus canaveralius]PLR86916.1 YfhD family protein [Bacillus sp. V33-4]PLR90818.1 YfhD family protein [Bacillus canaveralius]RSK53285.1 YfhD family protein [Bacillus canaveralius]
MGRANQRKTRDQAALSPIPADGIDVEYSRELADHEDLEAQARAKAADERARLGSRE